MSESCGCRVEYDAPPDGVRLTVPRIAYCPLHKAVPDLLADGAAFLEAVERHFNIDNDAVTFGPEARAFRAAIAKAKGEGLTVTAPERVYREVAPNVFEDITYEETVEQARIRAAIAKAKEEVE